MAVLYSGNFYVPLDPDMPANKLKLIIDDAGLKVIVGEEIYKKKLLEIGYSSIYLTREDIIQSKECEMPALSEQSFLYMVYTSGSTGKPKGVLKSHGAMISFIESYCKTFLLSASEIIGNQSPFFFDASAKDIYLMIKTGATLEIIPTELFSFPPMLMEYMNERKITFACWVPSAISLVARLNPFSLIKPSFLKKLFFVGEVMPVKHLNKWKEALPNVEYVNLYGQSEIAGICCYFTVGDTTNMTVIPIGKPIDNSRVYLYDSAEKQIITEADHIGEILIASPALANGYFHDMDRTNAAFAVEDFGNGPERFFRTGDLAQYDQDHNLVFAARSDFQIKHMGHRIELGEIEAVSESMKGLVSCCCLYHSEAKKIVLFCETERNAEINERAIREFLRTRLSAYMLPAKIVLLAHMPLNPNGKTDRVALKEMMCAL